MSGHLMRLRMDIVARPGLIFDDVTTSVILEELFFKQQVEKGLQDVAEGRVLSYQELKERMTRWRKSAGR